MKKEFLELLKELVSFAPVSADIDAVNRVSDRMAEFLKSRGVRVAVEDIEGRRTVYASALPEGKVSKLLFNAHLDVVPLSNPSQRIMTEKDGRVYGRGVGDWLGHAVTIAQLRGENPGKSVAAIFTTDEEIGGSTTAEMLRRGYQATEGVIVIDAWSGGNITSCEKGMMNVRLTAHGKSGHAAYPWNSVNALDLLLEGYHRLRQAWPVPAAEAWEDTLSATQISCDSTAFNVIPETASMVLNIRYTTPGSEEQILERIRSLTGLDDISVDPDKACPVYVDEAHPFLQKVREIASRVRGFSVNFAKMHGATDARHVAEICPGVPVLIDGALHGNIHAMDEWMDLANSEQLVEIYSEVIGNL